MGVDGGGTVLVVDDEPMVRLFMAAALRDHYRVIVAADGREALDVFRAAEGEVAAVLTDIAMPRLDGFGLAAELRRFDDPPPILFVSGFAGVAEVPAPFLQKPFDAQTLLAAVRQAMASHRPRRHRHNRTSGSGGLEESHDGHDSAPEETLLVRKTVA